MEQNFSVGQVICRPAIARDLEEIKQFCKTIWDGHDYIAEVIDDWFHDPQGIFAVAEYEGRAIACSKITRLARGQWWLEGFRVDPSYQGQKVGSLIHRFVDQWWLDHEGGALRLMTKNKAVHRVSEGTGFTKVIELRAYGAAPLAGRADLFTSAALGKQDLGPVVEFARRSPSLALTKGLVDFGWRCVNPTEPGALSDLFTGYPRLDQNFFWWKESKGLLITWDDSEPDEQQQAMGIGVLACELQDLSILLKNVRNLAAEQEKTSVFWLAPAHGPVERALKEAGFSSDWNHTAYVFEKKHPHRHQESSLSGTEMV